MTDGQVPSRIRHVLSSLACLLASSACAPGDGAELPDPPEGAEILLLVGDLEVYKVFEEEVCGGTLRRIDLQVQGLSDAFSMDPPRGRIFLHRDVEAVSSACGVPGIQGCARWWGAHATPVSVRHELVHVFVGAATDHVRTRPAIEEGVAIRMDGAPIEAAVDDVELAELLAHRSGDGLPSAEAAHFLAWILDEFGAEALLDAHVATAAEETDDGVGLALAKTLGFSTLEALEADYKATAAFAYPALPETATVFAAEDLSGGVDFDSSCAGPYAEGPATWSSWLPDGPSDPEVLTTARIEILESGEYEVAAPFDVVVYPGEPWLQPTEPWPDPVDAAERTPVRCSPDRPWRFLFGTPGHYEVVVANKLEEAVRGTLRVTHLEGQECP